MIISNPCFTSNYKLYDHWQVIAFEKEQTIRCISEVIFFSPQSCLKMHGLFNKTWLAGSKDISW